MNLYHSEEEISQTVLKFEVPTETFILPWFKSAAKYLQFNCYSFSWYLKLYEHFIYMPNKVSYETKSILRQTFPLECKKVFRIIVGWSCCVRETKFFYHF